jgi:hypothetical protein
MAVRSGKGRLINDLIICRLHNRFSSRSLATGGSARSHRQISSEHNFTLNGPISANGVRARRRRLKDGRFMRTRNLRPIHMLRRAPFSRARLFFADPESRFCFDPHFQLTPSLDKTGFDIMALLAYIVYIHDTLRLGRDTASNARELHLYESTSSRSFHNQRI